MLAKTREDLLERELLDWDERPIRHLLPPSKHSSPTHRAEARAKLTLARHHHAASPEPPAAGVPSGSRFPDLSSYQLRADLEIVRHDVDVRIGDLVVLKATEGLSYTDGYLVSRTREAAAVGFPHRGWYHFLHPSISGTEQAHYFLQEVCRATSDGLGPKAQDIVICDAEVTDGQSPRNVEQCVAEFGAVLLGHCPAKRWLYTGGPFAEEMGLQLAPFDAHWLPAYVSDPRAYYVRSFGVPVAWQYSDGHLGLTPNVVDGVGPCDISIVL